MADDSTTKPPFVHPVLPPVAELNKIASQCSAVAAAMPSALEIDAMKGLAEPLAVEVAKKAAEKACAGASEYIQKVKPEIMEDMKKASKKCSGGCCKSQKEKIERKGGSCGAVRDSAAATAQAASAGFCPGESVSIYQKIQQAHDIATKTLPLTEMTAITVPKTLAGTTAEPAIPELLAIIAELIATLESLIMTQEALLGKTYP